MQNTIFSLKLAAMETNGSGSAFLKEFFNEELYLVKKGGTNSPPALPVTENPKQAENVATQAPMLEEPLPKAADKATVTDISKEPALKIIGNAASRTLLLMHYPDGTIPLEEKKLLENILNAAGTSLLNCAWLNTAKQADIQWEKLNTQSHAEVIISFGTDEGVLPQPMQEGETLKAGSKKILMSIPLAMLVENQESKKTLWKGLKELYGI